jgi:hypothetical protein
MNENRTAQKSRRIPLYLSCAMHNCNGKNALSALIFINIEKGLSLIEFCNLNFE